MFFLIKRFHEFFPIENLPHAANFDRAIIGRPGLFENSIQ